MNFVRSPSRHLDRCCRHRYGGHTSPPPRLPTRSPCSLQPPPATQAQHTTRPKLVVLLVVDQMRADYVDKFRSQWTGGLKRLVQEGAWFHDAAYPYAATETCVGHSTISTGSFPASHGMIANAWWDRESQTMVTCTSDPKAKNSATPASPQRAETQRWRMLIPSFAEELKFQTGSATRVVTFSLKARASITMAGHKADAATWFDHGGWVTSSVYGTMPFIEDYVKAHPVSRDYGKTWTLSLPESAYWYDEKATNAGPPEGWDSVVSPLACAANRRATNRTTPSTNNGRPAPTPTTT